MPSHSFGPVQPLGARKTIIGHTGNELSLFLRAFSWIALIFSIALSKPAAISGCIFSGSVPSTKIGSQPSPSKYLRKFSFDSRDKIVGLEILKPFKFKIGNTAPSFTGLMNLFDIQEAANGPVSASPSPTTAATIRSGLSKTAPVAWEIEYPNSPPSWIEPGVSGAAWEATPPGNEKRLKSFFIPATSCVISGKSSV